VNSYLLEALYKHERVKFIMARQETGAAFMADMYARLSGKLGVCLSTAGPGATNMVTGVASAHRDGVPVLAITGQPATHTTGKGAVQESTDFGVNTVEIYEKCCGLSALVYDPVVFPQMMTRSLRMALGEHRQAVHLSFPADVSAHKVPSYNIPQSVSTYRVSYSGVDREPLKKAARVLLAVFVQTASMMLEMHSAFWRRTELPDFCRKFPTALHRSSSSSENSKSWNRWRKM
jgi:acetolactate synthase-1/2/3 large subunit